MDWTLFIRFAMSNSNTPLPLVLLSGKSRFCASPRCVCAAAFFEEAGGKVSPKTQVAVCVHARGRDILLLMGGCQRNSTQLPQLLPQLVSRSRCLQGCKGLRWQILSGSCHVFHYLLSVCGFSPADYNALATRCACLGSSSLRHRVRVFAVEKNRIKGNCRVEYLAEQGWRDMA